MADLTFSEYQRKSRRTAAYPTIGEPFIYPTLGLVGEVGEVAEKVKKIFRDKGGTVDAETRAAVEKELGDVLWYMAQLATELGLSLDDVAAGNIKKLLSRLDRGTLHGDGDER